VVAYRQALPGSGRRTGPFATRGGPFDNDGSRYSVDDSAPPRVEQRRCGQDRYDHDSGLSSPARPGANSRVVA
jgi:hypothetical protein